jgi:hypothetical protein
MILGHFKLKILANTENIAYLYHSALTHPDLSAGWRMVGPLSAVGAKRAV